MILGQRIVVRRDRSVAGTGACSMRDKRCAVTEIQARSEAAECRRLRKVVSRLAADALCSPHAVADVELAVGEAFSNAVKHGARNAKVSLRVEARSERELAVEVAYPGRQFDTTVTCPTDMHEGRGGFGRFIMQQILDGMEYSFRDGRTTVRMLKRR